VNSRKNQMIQTLQQHLQPITHLEVINESSNHRVPVGSESHFKVIIVSTAFETLSRIQRHQTINTLLKSHFNNGLHALSLHPYTPTEWSQKQQAPTSPVCQHKLKSH
jgi:BolA protein